MSKIISSKNVQQKQISISVKNLKKFDPSLSEFIIIEKIHFLIKKLVRLETQFYGSFA